MRIQHNIAALNSYRNLTVNNSAVSKNLEKLSSGYKINRAGDDAAGLAISEKMRAQITGLETAQKNANDGISLIQTAEGALTEVHSMLNRMVELANQSANGTYQDSDRANLQAEIQALKDEIDRISEGTNFNGINLLDGSLGNKVSITTPADVALTSVADGQLGAKPQIGVFSFNLSQLSLSTTNADVSLTMKIGGATVSGADGKAISVSLASGATMAGATFAAKLNGGSVTLDGVRYNISVNGGEVTLTGEKAPTVKNITANYKVDLYAGSTTNGGSTNFGNQFAVTVEKEPISAAGGRIYAQAEFSLTSAIVKDGGALKIGDTTYVFAVGKNSAYKNAANVVDLTDLEESSAKLVQSAAARLTKAAKGNANFYVGTALATSANGVTMTITEKEGGVDYAKNNLAGTNGIGGAGTASMDASAANWRGLIQSGSAALSGNSLSLQIGDTSDDFNQLTVAVNSMSSDSLGLSSVDISTQAGAKVAVDKIKAAINLVSSQRGDLGALQNRLEHTINNLSVTTENMTAAESRIRDVDMAKEMMAYTKNNILVQASQAMLAQANQIPQGVLQLLQ